MIKMKAYVGDHKYSTIPNTRWFIYRQSNDGPHPFEHLHLNGTWQSSTQNVNNRFSGYYKSRKKAREAVYKYNVKEGFIKSNEEQMEILEKQVKKFMKTKFMDKMLVGEIGKIASLNNPPHNIRIEYNRYIGSLVIYSKIRWAGKLSSIIVIKGRGQGLDFGSGIWKYFNVEIIDIKETERGN